MTAPGRWLAGLLAPRRVHVRDTSRQPTCGLVCCCLPACVVTSTPPPRPLCSCAQELCNKIMAGQYTAPEWLSPAMKDLLARMLTTDPDKRITFQQVGRTAAVHTQVLLPPAPLHSAATTSTLAIQG